jgi:hypothetical protein
VVTRSPATRSIDLSATTDVPVGGKTASVGITVTNTGPIGFLTLFNGDTADADRPNTSVVTWSGVGTRTTNSTTVRTGVDGTVKIYVSEATDVVVDVSGWSD